MVTLVESLPATTALPLLPTWIRPRALDSVNCTLPWLAPVPSLRLASTSVRVKPALLRLAATPSVTAKAVLAMVSVGASLMGVTLVPSNVTGADQEPVPPKSEAMTIPVPATTVVEPSDKRTVRLPGVPL